MDPVTQSQIRTVQSCAAEARKFPLEEKEREVMESVWPFNKRYEVQDSGFQKVIVLSEADANTLPSSEKVIGILGECRTTLSSGKGVIGSTLLFGETFAPPWDLVARVLLRVPLIVFQSLTVPSSCEEARRWPRGEKTTVFTALAWPMSVKSRLPVTGSHRLTVESTHPNARRRLSGENATHVTSSSKTCRDGFQSRSTSGKLLSQDGVW